MSVYSRLLPLWDQTRGWDPGGLPLRLNLDLLPRVNHAMEYPESPTSRIKPPKEPVMHGDSALPRSALSKRSPGSSPCAPRVPRPPSPELVLPRARHLGRRRLTPSRLPARTSACILCPPFDSAVRVGVRPAAELRHVQGHNHEQHVQRALCACPSPRPSVEPRACRRRHRIRSRADNGELDGSYRTTPAARKASIDHGIDPSVEMGVPDYAAPGEEV